MTVKSVVGEGTTFTFTLPVVPETGRVKAGHMVPRFLTTSGPTAIMRLMWQYLLS